MAKEKENAQVKSNEPSSEETKIDKIMEKLEESILQNINSNDVQKELVAVTPILYESKYYNPGESLPAYDVDMVNAWLKAKTAKWKEKNPKFLKANAASATSGLTGTAIPASKEDLIGKIPER